MTIPDELQAPLVIRRFIDPSAVKRLFVDANLAYYPWAERSSDPAVKNALIWGGLGVTKLAHLGIYTMIKPIVDAIEQRWPGAVFLPSLSTFRRIERATYIYWHMDADGTGSHAIKRVWNCWVPLIPVGQDGSPSLEVIANSGAAMEQIFGPNSGPNPDNRAHRPDDWVANNFPYPETICPSLDVGDVMVFSHWLLHRTQPMEHLSGRRIGLEMRFTIADVKPEPTPVRPPVRWQPWNLLRFWR